MTANQLPVEHQPQNSVGLDRSQRNIPKAQESIYEFLLEIVKIWSPEDVLAEFQHLFIHHADTTNASLLLRLYEIVLSNQEQEFRNTLKRSCYILINNWELTRNQKYIHQLVQSFSDPILYKHTISPTLKRLRAWLQSFVGSEDFRELKLFASRYEECDKVHWSQRYASYLLVTQYTNLENPVEQRQAARHLASQLKRQFKFDLARYTALSKKDSSGRVLPNPTSLGDEVLHLVKRLVARRGFFNYPNIAHIFINQTQHLEYRSFKRSLQEYLVFALEQNEFLDSFKHHLTEKLEVLYVEHDYKPIDSLLLLRTANRLVDYLTTENRKEPSPLFVQLLSQGNPLTLVLLLLKVILMCGYARTHLETRIADLIKYYEKYSEEECQWIVNFFEVFKVTMAIYTEDLEFNLVRMASRTMNDSGSNSDRSTSENFAMNANLETYRIFSQRRQKAVLNQDPDIREIMAVQAAIEGRQP